METDINEVLQVPTIFANVSKGMLASKAELQEAFGTSDQTIICAEILDKGDLQVSEKERQTLLANMFRDVASIVVEKSVNPENDRPYTLSIIQNAMKSIHFSVKLNKTAKKQALDVIKQLKRVMPIARTKMHLRITCAANVAASMQIALQDAQAALLSTSVSPTDPSLLVIECRVEADGYAKIDKSLMSITDGRGLLEIVHQASEVPANTSVTPIVPVSMEELSEEVQSACVVTKPGVVQAEESDEEVLGMVKPKKKMKNKAKKEKNRAVEESDSNSEADSDADEEDEAPEHTSAPMAKSHKKANKQGKKSKRIEREKLEEEEVKTQERQKRLEEVKLHLEASAATTPASTTNAEEASGLSKCNTCSGVFATKDQYRAHFRSDWHRINLKRKMKELPLITSEIEFYSKNIDEWDVVIN